MQHIGGLGALEATLGPVARRFNQRGHRLYLVGGAVRDLFLASAPSDGDDVGGPTDSGFDLDLTTDARPEVIKELLAPGAEALWSQGERFGTIGVRVGGHDLEVTTHRAEVYDPESRKPVVTYGEDLDQDLSRRDFTINAMAIELPDGQLRDPYGGAADLGARVLRTPLSPEISFTDDPLRMLRAARFVSRYRLTPVPELVAAAGELADRLDIVSVERVNDELERLLSATDPGVGLEFLLTTGLLGRIVPAYRTPDADGVADRTAVALASAPGSTLVRRAGLLWPLGPDMPEILSRLRYSNDDRALTQRLRSGVAAALAAPTDEASVRRLVADVGVDHLDDALALVANLAAGHPDVSSEVAEALTATARHLDNRENLADLGSPLSGSEIMDVLGLQPGPEVGRAQRYLTSVRIDNGPLGTSDARDLLLRWWRQERG